MRRTQISLIGKQRRPSTPDGGSSLPGRPTTRMGRRGSNGSVREGALGRRRERPGRYVDPEVALGRRPPVALVAGVVNVAIVLALAKAGEEVRNADDAGGVGRGGGVGRLLGPGGGGGQGRRRLQGSAR